jgi:hypothetical protein
MEPVGSLSRSQPTTRPHPEPDESSPCHPALSRSRLILSSHLRLRFPSGLLPSGFPTKTPYAPLPSTVSVTPIFLLDFITQTISGQHKSCSSLPRPSQVQISYSSACSRKPWACPPSSTWETKFHTHTIKHGKLKFFICASVSRLTNYSGCVLQWHKWQYASLMKFHDQLRRPQHVPVRRGAFLWKTLVNASLPPFGLEATLHSDVSPTPPTLISWTGVHPCDRKCTLRKIRVAQQWGERGLMQTEAISVASTGTRKEQTACIWQYENVAHKGFVFHATSHNHTEYQFRRAKYTQWHRSK